MNVNTRITVAQDPRQYDQAANVFLIGFDSIVFDLLEW